MSKCILLEISCTGSLIKEAFVFNCSQWFLIHSLVHLEKIQMSNMTFWVSHSLKCPSPKYANQWWLDWHVLDAITEKHFISTRFFKIWNPSFNTFHAGYFFMIIFGFSADFFFQNQLFGKILSGIPSGCQTVWIQIRTDILLVLIWVQTVGKGYQQMTKVAASKERIKGWFHIWASTGGLGTYCISAKAPLIHYSIITPFDAFKKSFIENIMENGAFAFWSKCSIFHNIFKSIQNLN